MVRMMAPTGYHIIWYLTIINMFKNITDEILLHIYEPSDSTVFFPTLRLICIQDKYPLSQGDKKSPPFVLPTKTQNETNISCQRGIKCHLKALIYMSSQNPGNRQIALMQVISNTINQVGNLSQFQQLMLFPSHNWMVPSNQFRQK